MMVRPALVDTSDLTEQLERAVPLVRKEKLGIKD